MAVMAEVMAVGVLAEDWAPIGAPHAVGLDFDNKELPVVVGLANSVRCAEIAHAEVLLHR